MIYEKKITLPISLIVLSSGIAGGNYEIFPLLLKNIKSQQELITFGDNMMDLIGHTYLVTNTGSMMWLIYKHFCKKDIYIFIECANTIEKRNELKKWLINNEIPN